ncbi:HNH/ENDO VII family nuclease [Rummeliibacillus suwonensis]|uniref:HNH/ENDO VII family nuclease n=1 Tax=Rummeliibacillus suwonensis TaxID=1306154 RepID=UPI001AAF3057|nr:HNH/ENDO VII family nuclease [Rummeliibacillus suwonensis]MBO2536956.1 HNH/ENDO VII family nuclease [Rummeliibacillus suwonensis]
MVQLTIRGGKENPHEWKLHFIDDPGKSIEGTIQAIKHPIETYDYLSQSIADSFERDVINGDAKSRAKWISYALGNVVLSVVGTKGLGAVTKTGMTTVKATAKVGVSKVKGAAQKIPTLNLYPYVPQHQLADVNAGIVPYNTVNIVGLRDQLISKAQKVSNTSRVPFTGKSISVPWLSDKYNAVEIKGKVKAKGKIKDIDRRVYQIKNLDIHRVDSETGKTNLQLMKKGRPPFANDGSIVNLHHLIQEEPGTMLEIPESLHKKYSKMLHGLKENGESFRNDPVLKAEYDNFRIRYWKWRAKEFEVEK